MGQSQNALSLLNEELLTLLQSTPHVLELETSPGGFTLVKRACECSTQHNYCPEVRMLSSWAIIWDAYHHLQQGYAFKARAHKFTLMLHHSPFSLKLRLRQRGIKLEMQVQRRCPRLCDYGGKYMPSGISDNDACAKCRTAECRIPDVISVYRKYRREVEDDD